MVKNNNTHNTNPRQFFVYCLLILCTLTSTVATAANITVTTSRNPVSLDDSFHLIYEANSRVDEDPDFSPIYKDFEILRSSQSTNMRSVNGSWDLKKTWDLTVIAKDIGQYTIPAIKFGSDTSPAIRIKIVNSTSPSTPLNNATNGATIPAKIFLETSVDKTSGWVQAQFIYSIRLLRTVTIAGASISELTTTDPDALIQMISEDNYQTTRNGIRYEVFERRYAVFPQKSGVLKINPVIFDGRVNATQPRSLFDQFRMSGQQKRLRSKAIELNIKPAPATINLQDWLPAKEIQLVEDWSDDIRNLKAGEPVTRTIMIAADGLSGVQLPDLKFNEITDLKQYPDKAIIEDKPGTSGITGYKQIKVALLPAKAGRYTLPKVELQWWNTQTNKKEIATLPETVLHVSGSAVTYIPAPPVQTENTSLANKPLSTTDTTSKPTLADEINPSYWKWLALFFAAAWLITLILYFRKPVAKLTQNKTKISSPLQSIKAAASNVEKFAKKNDANNTKKALIEWAVVAYNDNSITNLSQIGEYCSPQFNQLIRQLNETLYRTETKSWNGKLLLSAFKDEQIFNSKKHDKPSSPLKPLYNP
jgi:hypothetical protein